MEIVINESDAKFFAMELKRHISTLNVVPLPSIIVANLVVVQHLEAPDVPEEAVEKHKLLNFLDKCGTSLLPVGVECSLVGLDVPQLVGDLHVLPADVFSLLGLREVVHVVNHGLIVANALVEVVGQVETDRVEPAVFKVDQNHLLVVLKVHEDVVFLSIVVT